MVTYDYRGIGNSGSPREFRAIRMRNWMSADVPSVAEWMRNQVGDVPHLAVGHSIGGHAMSLDYGTEDLAGFVTVTSHAGVTAAIPGRAERARVAAILRVIGPAFARTLGYVQSRRLGIGENMLGGAMLEWSAEHGSPGTSSTIRQCTPVSERAECAPMWSSSTQRRSLGYSRPDQRHLRPSRQCERRATHVLPR